MSTEPLTATTENLPTYTQFPPSTYTQVPPAAPSPYTQVPPAVPSPYSQFPPGAPSYSQFPPAAPLPYSQFPYSYGPVPPGLPGVPPPPGPAGQLSPQPPVGLDPSAPPGYGSYNQPGVMYSQTPSTIRTDGPLDPLAYVSKAYALFKLEPLSYWLLLILPGIVVSVARPFIPYGLSSLLWGPCQVASAAFALAAARGRNPSIGAAVGAVVSDLRTLLGGLLYVITPYVPGYVMTYSLWPLIASTFSSTTKAELAIGLLVSIIIAFIACTLLAIYLALCILYLPYLLVDHPTLNPIDLLGKSAAAINGQFFTHFFLIMTVIVVGVSGIFCCGFGALITFPMAQLMVVYAYLDVFRA